MNLRVTVLGSGSSGGVPLVGCRCGVCTSTNPKNRRLRVSIVVESAATRILVDASPDLREQLLRFGETRFDAVIFTHAHADHMHGIDEIRSINYAIQAPIDCFADAETLAEAQRRFGYAFGPLADLPGGHFVVPVLRPVPIRYGAPVRVGDIEFVGFEQMHGGDRMPTLGLRFGPFAYSTDVKALDDRAFAALEGVDTWIVDCLQEAPNWAHSHLDQSLEWVRRVKPRRAFLTHMNHRVEYADWLSRLPESVEPAFDGLQIDVASAIEA